VEFQWKNKKFNYLKSIADLAALQVEVVANQTISYNDCIERNVIPGNRRLNRRVES
jgi:hypothetical protein